MKNLGKIKAEHTRAVEAKAQADAAAAKRNELISQALAQGVSAVEVASALGLHRSRIYQMAKTTGKENQA